MASAIAESLLEYQPYAVGILETRNHFELYFLENAQEKRAELIEKIEMKKVVKIINSAVLIGKNKKEDIADNFVIMKVKKNEFIKNL